MVAADESIESFSDGIHVEHPDVGVRERHVLGPHFPYQRGVRRIANRLPRLCFVTAFGGSFEA